MIKRLLPIMLMISSAGLLVQLQHPLAYASAEKELELKFLGRYQSGIFGPDRSAAESLTHDPETQRLFIVNVAENRMRCPRYQRSEASREAVFYRSCALR